MKKLRGLGIVLLALLAVAALITLRPAYTPRIPGDAAVASLESVRLGGERQWILIRGASASLPLLLFLHGGPGMPAMYLAHRFQRPLEKEFLVVHCLV